MAFPNLTTGVYGVPKALAAEVVVQMMYPQLTAYQYLNKIIFVLAWKLSIYISCNLCSVTSGRAI